LKNADGTDTPSAATPAQGHATTEPTLIPEARFPYARPQAVLREEERQKAAEDSAVSTPPDGAASDENSTSDQTTVPE
jgi:hypothetical protein